MFYTNFLFTWLIIQDHLQIVKNNSKNANKYKLSYVVYDFSITLYNNCRPKIRIVWDMIDGTFV